MPSKTAYFPYHLWGKVPACSDSCCVADGIRYFLKVCLCGACNFARCSRVQRRHHVPLPFFANHGQVPAESLDGVVDIEDVFGFVGTIPSVVDEDLLRQKSRRIRNINPS